MRISIIAAMNSDRVIGKDGEIPWYLPNDLRTFKALTLHNSVIMGRKTYESIGQPLKDRINIIVTKQKDYRVEGCTVVNSISDALGLCLSFGDSECFIIGGAEIYSQTIDISDRMYLTFVPGRVEGGVRFPEFDQTEWDISTSMNYGEYTFHIFDRLDKK